MAFEFNGGFSTLSLMAPSKPIEMTAPDVKSLSLHDGEDAGQYQSFLEVVNSLAQAFKFLPKYDQMKYQQGNPLLLLGKDDAAVKAYIDALVEFEPDLVKKADILGYRDTLLDSTKSSAARKDAVNQIQHYADAVFASTYSKQAEIQGSSRMLSYDSAANDIYYFGQGQIVGGSEKVYVGGALKTAGIDYTVDYATGKITFSSGVFTSGSQVIVGFEFRKMLGEGLGVGYSNIDYSPEAFDWNLIDDSNLADSSGSSVIGYLNTNFGAPNTSFWSQVSGSTFGGGLSFYQIAKQINDGTLALSDIDAFNLMCSMLESRERVFGAYKSIFGDYTGGALTDAQVTTNFNNFLNLKCPDVDIHNLTALRMFFGMQTDFINTVDAYMNSTTYWGWDLTTKKPTDLGNFNSALMAGVDNYINISLVSGSAKQLAASNLKLLWLGTNPRWDKVGSQWTGELVNTTGSWVGDFSSTMRDYGEKDLIRLITCRMFNRAEKKEYDREKAVYEAKKEQLILDEIAQLRAQAKRKAENRKAFSRFVARGKSTAAIRGKAAVGRIKARIQAAKRSAVAVKQKQAAGRGHIIRSKQPAVAAKRPHGNPGVAVKHVAPITARPVNHNAKKHTPTIQVSSIPAGANNSNRQSSQNQKKQDKKVI